MNQMSVVRRNVWMVLVGLSVMVAPQPLSAAGPAIIMYYGDSLTEPIFIVQREAGDFAKYSGLYCARGSSPVTAERAGDRPFLKMAMFWGNDFITRVAEDPGMLSTLEPKQAQQHGRLYLPNAGASPYVVATEMRPGRDPGTGQLGPATQAIPDDLSGFTQGCGLSPDDMEIAVAVGALPG
jgi:hypothetical protein